MNTKYSNPIITKVLDEQNQGSETRHKLFQELEKRLKRPIVTFYTSFTHPVLIEDRDADILEGILQKLDLSNGLVLVVSSPGGLGLSAERIANICRNYSKTNEYWAVVPSKAKSAATIICMGASKILMGPTSELGPIDPQIGVEKRERGLLNVLSVYNIVQSYDDLFARAVSEKGNLQPYMLQLSNYDDKEIAELRAGLELSKDIAVKLLRSGMMKGKSETQIKEKIKIFLIPEEVKTHGRPIYRARAKRCGLIVESKRLNETSWKLFYELHVRTNNFVSTQGAKCIESKDHSFYVPLPKEYKK